MHQNAFGGRAPPRTRWWSLSAPPDPLAAKGGLLLKGGEGKERGKGKEGFFGPIKLRLLRPCNTLIDRQPVERNSAAVTWSVAASLGRTVRRRAALVVTAPVWSREDWPTQSYSSLCIKAQTSRFQASTSRLQLSLRSRRRWKKHVDVTLATCWL